MIEKNELIDAELDTVSGGHFRKGNVPADVELGGAALLALSR